MVAILTSVAMFVAPFAVCMGLTLSCRDEQPALHLGIWLVGMPAMCVLVPLVVLLVSFQVFGIDLLG